MTPKELREKRAPLLKRLGELQAILNKNGEWTPDEDAEFKKLEAEITKLNRQILVAEQVEAASDLPEPVERPELRPGRGDVRHEPRPEPAPVRREQPPAEQLANDRNLAYHAWFLHSSPRTRDSITAQHVEAAQRIGVNLNSPEIAFDLRNRYDDFRRSEMRALSAVIPTAGEFTVPDSFSNALERAMLWYGGIRQVSTVMRTASGEPILWPTSNDTGNTGAQINENVTVSQQDVTFGAITFHAYMYTSKMVLVPFTLLQDSAFNIAVTLGDMLGERLGRIANTDLTVGNGAGKPYGIVTKATTFSAAAATSISWDDIYGLVHSVDPAYRNGPGVGFMMHDTIVKQLRLLKDGNGRYLWVDSLQAGQPATILGYPVTVNNDMASTIASGAKTVLFGQLTKYMIRDVGQIRLRRLTERFADTDQEAFLAFARFDGNLLDAGVAPVKVLTH